MGQNKGTTVNQQLRRERLSRGWTQANVAEKIESDPKTVGRWERGEATPSPYYIGKLCKLFEKQYPEELGFAVESPPRSFPDANLPQETPRPEQTNTARIPPSAMPPPRPQWLPISLVLTAVVVVAAGTLAALYFRNSSSPPFSTPDELYRMVTSSKPALTDALTGHDANGWQEDAIREGGCKYQGGAYHSYVLITAVHECLADAAPSFRRSTTFAVQVELTFVRGDGGGGLVFCYTGMHVPYYRLVVRSDGYLDLFDPATGVRGASGAVSPSTRYRLTAIVRATTVYLYINGISMAQGSLESGASLDGGKVGVFSVDGPHNPTDVVFHNFSVWVAA